MTAKGICAIFIGGSRDRLIDDLKRAFLKARISTGSKQLNKSIANVVKLVDDPCANVALPLDIRGTAFQQRVWQALQKIPIGSTKTYTQIANELGNKKSIRAVARACATNTIAIAIPCHRVIRSDGTLAGYRWGLDRKQKLLDREKKR
jgi:AraC family transcriptional regulator of adaptative response/methylated-DNA-[protein]-cysteine methyltransferase